ncbi:hypothetical protein PV326_005490 [Microctonus aethiopoides]|nr:hypothetical protein PV326_005490 [Microctonus aethiopoides]
MKEQLDTISQNMEPSERTALRQKLESIDDILPYVGSFGTYQWYLLLSLFPYSIIYSNLYFSTFFLTLVPQEHWCYVPELQKFNMTMDERVQFSIPTSDEYPYYEKCVRKDLNYHQLNNTVDLNAEMWQTNRSVKCEKWEYNTSQVPYLSIGSELDWVCDKEQLISSSQSLFFVGSILGGFIFGWIADHRGRVPALTLCCIIAIVGTIATAFATSFWSFALCRFITGFAFDNCINIPLILVVEYVAVNRRTIVFNVAFGVYFALGSTVLPWIAYYVSNWRYFSYIVALTMVSALFTPWILPESARWYASTGQWEKVVQNLKNIARVNKKNPDPRIYDIYVRNARRIESNTQSASLLDLFRTPRLAKTTILIICFWTLTIVCFDGHVYSLKLLPSSVFVSFSLASSTELPAGLLVTLILDRWGRRFCGFLTLAAISCFSFTELYLPSAAGKLSSSVLARFSGNMAANIGLQYSAELLPTPVRGQGVALIHIFGIIAHAIAPYITDLAEIWYGFPMTLIGTLAFATATLVLFLPETAGRELPQTLQQGEDFSKGQRFWTLPCFEKIEIDPEHDENNCHIVER